MYSSVCSNNSVLLTNVNSAVLISGVWDEDIVTVDDKVLAGVGNSLNTPWVSCISLLELGGASCDSSIVDFVAIVIVPEKVNILTALVVECEVKEATGPCFGLNGLDHNLSVGVTCYWDKDWLVID